MCGIAGAWGAPGHEMSNNLQKMVSSLSHRGPDHEGIWLDESQGLGLGHRRLAILDLSATGNQPMTSKCGRYVLTFNGEIYNFLELRKKLLEHDPGIIFEGESDTEVLLASLSQWGLQNTLRDSVGMFALALWDRAMQKLTLARDRLGEKPLYYGWCNRVFLFGSELKSLRQHSAFRSDIDRNALASYMERGYISSPRSIYRNIFKLPPGHFISIDSPARAQSNLNQPAEYWSAPKPRAKVANAESTNFNSVVAITQLEQVLGDAVKSQMVADVGVGAFLSGGIDSSLIVALMQQQSLRKVKTFAVGFEEADYNEAHHARRIAEHLGTDHSELIVDSRAALDVIPCLATIYDEPFADPSQIPTVLLARFTRSSVKVSLSGDGGDELFGGYARYRQGEQIWSTVSQLPPWSRRLSASTLGLIQYLLQLSAHTASTSPKPTGLSVVLNDRRLERLKLVLGANGFRDFYSKLTAHWMHPGLVLGTDTMDEPQHFSAGDEFADPIGTMMYLDTVGYLPDDILVKVDRAGMSVGLETRIPFLDHRVVEFANSLPASFKARAGHPKWLLKQLLGKLVPAELFDRPKMGFGIPVGSWLRGPLVDWAESLLSPSALHAQGFLNTQLVRQAWDAHKNGQQDLQFQLWNVLMFQSWLAEQQQ